MLANAGSASRAVLTKQRALAVLGLDVEYERGQGSALYERTGAQNARAVWDFVGGYGACLFGHNHPELVAVVREFLQSGGVQQAQASVRPASAELGARLARRLHASVARHYHVVLANTGSEATELAARHTELVYLHRRNAARAWVAAGEPFSGGSALPARLRERLAAAGNGALSIGTYDDLQRHNDDVLAAAPVLLALQRGFHGCTTGARALTWDPGCRFGARADSGSTRFVDPADGEALEALLADLSQPLLRVVRVGDDLDIESLPWTRVSAFFLEPLQGEGGIHPLRAATVRAWQTACRAYGVPIVADEIQSGMGRTGTFLYAEQIGLAPDYVLLGKSLGGGLAKISAVAIDAARDLPAFALQYASTFAEDELSSRVALRALRLLAEEGVLERATERGEQLRAALEELVARHPTVLREVRGCGLMLGLEWRPRAFERSAALRFLHEYGWLDYAIAGYLLRVWRVRVAPALAQGSTLRIEPDYALPDAAIERLVTALDAVCELLEREDAASILAPALGAAPPRVRLRRPPRALCRPLLATPHVAFIGHFIDADGVALWDASFARLDAAARRTFLERIEPFAEPLLCHRDHVRSPTGEAATLSFIGVPVSSEQCYAALRGSGRHDLRELVQRAVDMAAREGCSVVGLGGYCSILTRNGKTLQARDMAITTGNGFTVGAALLALRTAAATEGIDLPHARAAVIGATGNIGSVAATLLAGEVGALTLIARPQGLDDLYALAGRLLHELLRRAPDAPILCALRRGGCAIDADASAAELAEVCRHVRAERGDDAPLLIGAAPDLCRGAQLIVAASNQPAAIVLPEHLSHAGTVIVDLAVPGDVHPSVERERPRVRVLRGGVVRTPCNPDWYVPGIPLEPGEMFACMAETALMGLDGARAHGSFGALTGRRVRETLALARRYGFTDVYGGSASARTPLTAHASMRAV